MPDVDDQLVQAGRLVQEGRFAEARAASERLLALRPRLAAAHRILGLCLRQQGDVAGAEACLRTGLKLDRGDPALAIDLADLLAADARQPEAEKILRAAMALNRRSTVLVVRLAQMLLATGRAEEALQLTSRPAALPVADHAILAEHAAALKALGQPDKALSIHERAAQLYPDSAVAHHNLAGSLGDLGHVARAERSAARALSRGGNAPQTWLVHARALLGLRRLDDAERAFRGAIARQPGYVDAHRDLAQLIWMRSEDPAAATALLDAELRADPGLHALWGLRANLLHHAGDVDGAFATLLAAIRIHPEQPDLQLAASHIAALCGQADAAVRYAERAAVLAPGDHAEAALFAACVAAGQAERAAAIAARMVERRPSDQRALAYQATAWRLLGDSRYATLYDYAALVRSWRMDVPDGWDSLDAYLADLARALGGVHAFRTHPLDQSLRHGSQAAHLLNSDDPTIRAFFQAIDGPIRRHLGALGDGRDPLRVRNTGEYSYQGVWSVRLRPGGFHTDHIHPQGWLSSACYVALPRTDAASREAWIKFGEPGIPTRPALAAEHFIRPEPGMLVLFPSYMWHGTVPFTDDAPRLSVAFDLVPGRARDATRGR